MRKSIGRYGQPRYSEAPQGTKGNGKAGITDRRGHRRFPRNLQGRRGNQHGRSGGFTPLYLPFRVSLSQFLHSHAPIPPTPNTWRIGWLEARCTGWRSGYSRGGERGGKMDRSGPWRYPAQPANGGVNSSKLPFPHVFQFPPLITTLPPTCPYTHVKVDSVRWVMKVADPQTGAAGWKGGGNNRRGN